MEARARFLVIPALDVLGGRCVRLAGGKRERVTVEGGDPARAASRFGAALVVAIDARAGRVMLDGWTRESQVEAGELARRCAAAGVARLLVTSTRRDGSLAGPDVPLLEEVLDAASLPVLAAGGIA